MKLLDGKTAIITGASRGIGKGIALKFAEQGANIAFTYLSSEEKAKILEAELSAFGITTKGFKSDASDFDSAQQLAVDVMETFGSIDVVVNNAGITKDNLLMRMSEEEWDTVLNTNLKGAFNFTKAFTRPFMKQRSGRIINIASVIGLIGNAGQSNYAASKAALIGSTKSVAKELAPRGVTANAIAPGFIETDMTAVLDEKVREAILERVPMSKFGSPDDIAHTAVFLAMEPTGYMTGQVLTVDGGMVM